MKRPFVYLGFSYVLWLLVALFLPESFHVPLLAVGASASLVTAFMVFYLKKKNLFSLMVSSFTLVLAVLMMFVFGLTAGGTVDILENETYFASGEILEVLPKSENANALDVKINKIGKTQEELTDVSDITVRLYSFEEIRADEFDEIAFKADFFSYDDVGILSTAKQNYSDNLHMYAFESNNKEIYVEEVDNKSIFYYILQIRNYFSFVIDDSVSNNDMVKALILADRDAIDDEMNELFSRTGLNHILVVSGMHISIITFAVIFLLRKIFKGKKFIYLIVIAFILFYMTLCGFGTSVVRSGIMLILICISNFFGADTDSLNSLGFACFLICLINPFSAIDLGFILSMTATLGIILFYDKIYDKLKFFVIKESDEKAKNVFLLILKKVYIFICASLSVAVSANITIIPVSLLFFNSVNFMAVLNSTILTPIFSVVIILSFIMLISPFGGFIGNIVDMILDLAVLIIRNLAEIKGLTTFFSREIATLLFVFTVIIISVALVLRGRKYLIRTSLISLGFVYLTAVVCTYIGSVDMVKLLYIPSGNTAFVALVHEGEAAIVCSGEDDYAKGAYELKNLGISEVTMQLAYETKAEQDASHEIKKILNVEKEIDETAEGVEYYPFEDKDISIKYELRGDISYLSIYGTTVVFEKNALESTETNADLALVCSDETKINSALAVIAKENFSENIKNGNYIILEEEYFLANIGKDKKFSIRSEN